MMKRPRSFISAMLLLGTLLVPVVALNTHASIVAAAGLPRVMDPRAGDPDEPDPTIDSTVDQSEQSGLVPTQSTLTWQELWWTAWRWYAR